MDDQLSEAAMEDRKKGGYFWDTYIAYLYGMKISDFQTLQLYLREQDIFGRFGLSRIGVFGSFARGEEFRDLDLLIEDDIPYQKLIALRDELQTDLTIPVDLMIRRYAEPIILRSALKDIQHAVTT